MKIKIKVNFKFIKEIFYFIPQTDFHKKKTAKLYLYNFDNSFDIQIGLEIN